MVTVSVLSGHSPDVTVTITECKCNNGRVCSPQHERAVCKILRAAVARWLNLNPAPPRPITTHRSHSAIIKCSRISETLHIYITNLNITRYKEWHHLYAVTATLWSSSTAGAHCGSRPRKSWAKHRDFLPGIFQLYTNLDAAIDFLPLWRSALPGRPGHPPRPRRRVTADRPRLLSDYSRYYAAQRAAATTRCSDQTH